ncbi:MAG: hypothetical protein QM642_12225, partial [Edaphocola sp.]
PMGIPICKERNLQMGMLFWGSGRVTRASKKHGHIPCLSPKKFGGEAFGLLHFVGNDATVNVATHQQSISFREGTQKQSRPNWTASIPNQQCQNKKSRPKGRLAY